MKKYINIIICMFVVIQVSACGGGGGSSVGRVHSSDVEQETDSLNVVNEDDIELVSYIPSGELLMSSAVDSNELYVEEDFKFTSSNQIALHITASDTDMNAISSKRISVYLVPGNMESWNDKNFEEASLITTGITNVSGLFERVLDVPNYDKQFLVVLHMVGIENKKLLKINNEYLVHHFQEKE